MNIEVKAYLNEDETYFEDKYGFELPNDVGREKLRKIAKDDIINCLRQQDEDVSFRDVCWIGTEENGVYPICFKPDDILPELKELDFDVTELPDGKYYFSTKKANTNDVNDDYLPF